jgi:hypothetical protein
MRTRVLIGAAGVLLGLFGVFRLLTQIPSDDLLVLFVWLLGALVIHDGLLSPLVVGVGALVTRFVPPRARGVLQGALVVAAAVTVIALPLIHREGSQPPVKAILRQDYAANLGVLIGLIAAGAVLLYAVRVLRDRQRDPQRASSANERPPADHTSPSP